MGLCIIWKQNEYLCEHMSCIINIWRIGTKSVYFAF